MSLPTLAGGRPPPGKNSPLILAEKEIGEAVRNELANLQSEDWGVVAPATASLFVLTTREEATPHLPPVIPKLVALLNAPDIYCQRNACGALTSILNASASLYQTVCTCYGLGPALVEALRNSDRGLRLNAGAALAALAQGPEGLETIAAAQADDELIANLRTETDDEVAESCADAICAIAANEERRPALLQKGAVGALGGLLGRPSSEVQVRALLALGMLTGSSLDGQLQLAATEGSMSALSALTRSSDADVKGIASDVLGGLARNTTLRPMLEEQLRKDGDLGHLRLGP